MESIIAKLLNDFENRRMNRQPVDSEYCRDGGDLAAPAAQAAEGPASKPSP